MEVILSKRRSRLLLSLCSGILMVLSFPYTGSVTALVFIAWIPLLLVERSIYQNRYRSAKLFIHAYITFFVYNLGTTWWIWNASPGGAILAFVLNSLLMTIPLFLFHVSKKKLGATFGFLCFSAYWIGFEYLHYHWELSWPWLNLGNCFSITPTWIQWYSYTGVLGGTLWILLVNYLGYVFVSNVLIKKQSLSSNVKTITYWAISIAVPIMISLFLYTNYQEATHKNQLLNVTVLQPNIDPYNEKFTSSLDSQLEKLCDLADRYKDSSTDMIIGPETAISSSFFEEDLSHLAFYSYLKKRKEKWGHAGLYTGASTFRFFENKHSRASRKLPDGPGYYESYNSSLLIDEDNTHSFLHKSKLVLGVEKLPFSDWLPILETLSINNGGTSGTLGVEKEPKVMSSHNVTFAPLICYESIYGAFNAEQCRKGAQAIFIITNDGWWGDTPGYKQHKSFACLRAIENRKFVARSANTGTSCFINDLGETTQQTAWWKMTGIKQQIQLNNQLTFYTQHGDLLGKISLLILICLLIVFFYMKFPFKQSN
jgi:apolipoprotein N-acyltransferase